MTISDHTLSTEVYRMYDTDGDYLFYTIDEDGTKHKENINPESQLTLVLNTLSEREGRRRRCREPHGLDQYLGLRKYVSKYQYPYGYTATVNQGEAGPFGKHRSIPARQVWPIPTNDEYGALGAFINEGFDKYADFSGIELRYPVGYWRNANAIHWWFVTLSGGYDKRQMIFVGRVDLKNLQTACESVLANRTQEEAEKQNLFPPPGSKWETQMDEWYFEDLERTVEMADYLLNLIPKDEDLTFTYNASW